MFMLYNDNFFLLFYNLYIYIFTNAIGYFYLHIPDQKRVFFRNELCFTYCVDMFMIYNDNFNFFL